LNCECGGRAWVYDSRDVRGQRIRRRICERCGRRIKTVEIEMQERPEFGGLADEIRRMPVADRRIVVALMRALQERAAGAEEEAARDEPAPPGISVDAGQVLAEERD